MKALLLEGKNQWQDMKVGEIDTPVPQKGEILVRNKAAGLNPVDYKTATNGLPAWEYPHVLGVDAAGIVEEVGEGVTTVQKGDRVVYHGNMSKKGTFAEYTVTPAHTVSILPETISFENGAAVPCAGYTAYQALFRKMHIQPGQTILIHAGAGGVGGFAIQLAKQAGLTVITTASASNHALVKSLGADYAIDYKQDDFVEKTLEITNGKGVHAVLDTVGRENATKSLDTIQFNGQIAFIAGPPDISSALDFTKSFSFHQIALGGAHLVDNVEEQQDLALMGQEMFQLIEEGSISTLLEKVVSLKEVPQALVDLSERHVTGKIVAKI
ncbi:MULTISPECIES: zinc-binding dehydrogenase [Pontibacillus]|uniref:Zinc-binding dehydrogenase n=1 Tax=Pontibacillus chungwhensis TaxID=265426 RepID=A0ABY8V724_9BACI|nr:MULTISPECIES: zinc-binding dehydrogenase [Pontibacillus]MCD5322368.1 zinc-binding dehydrogenase [Pontibacillus sp. HN14]WIF99656.1 zinc-binding dehydrogenase [Pontibacillus chungwhensis]